MKESASEGGVCSWRGCLLLGGVCSWGGVCSRGCVCFQGVSALGEVSAQGVSALRGVSALGGCILACIEADTPPVNRITDACKNITLAQLRCGR